MIYHPGKCGGTAIENLFLQTLRDTDLERLMDEPCFGKVVLGAVPPEWLNSRLRLMIGYLPQASSENGIAGLYLQHADIYASLKILGPEAIGRLFKLAFVRNPFPRLLSAYYYNLCDRKWTFREFVLDHLEAEVRLNRPYTVGHFGEMHRYTHLEGEQFVDFVGRLEQIESDVRQLSKTVGVPLDYGDNHRRAKSAASAVYGHYSEAYDDGMVDRVYDLYRDDFDHFGYSFERELAFRPQDGARAEAAPAQQN